MRVKKKNNEITQIGTGVALLEYLTVVGCAVDRYLEWMMWQCACMVAFCVSVV
jgi:hypothetical protein